MYKFNKLEILENGTIQLRQEEVLELANGETREGDFNRLILTPNTDIDTIECARCKAVALATWTDKVIADYKASIATNKD